MRTVEEITADLTKAETELARYQRDGEGSKPFLNTVAAAGIIALVIAVFAFPAWGTIATGILITLPAVSARMLYNEGHRMNARPHEDKVAELQSELNQAILKGEW